MTKESLNCLVLPPQNSLTTEFVRHNRKEEDSLRVQLQVPRDLLAVLLLLLCSSRGKLVRWRQWRRRLWSNKICHNNPSTRVPLNGTRIHSSLFVVLPPPPSLSFYRDTQHSTQHGTCPTPTPHSAIYLSMAIFVQGWQREFIRVMKLGAQTKNSIAPHIVHPLLHPIQQNPPSQGFALCIVFALISGSTPATAAAAPRPV